MTPAHDPARQAGGDASEKIGAAQSWIRVGAGMQAANDVANDALGVEPLRNPGWGLRSGDRAPQWREKR